MSEALREFEQLLQKRFGNQKAQVKWVTVKSVDWTKKTMTATGFDGLDYFNVLLGVGSTFVKPKVGKKATIVLLENSDGGLMIDCEQIEQITVDAGTTHFEIKEQGYVISRGSENLKTVLNDFITEVNKIIVIYGTSINVEAVNAIKQRLNTILQ